MLAVLTANGKCRQWSVLSDPLSDCIQSELNLEARIAFGEVIRACSLAGGLPRIWVDTSYVEIASATPF